MHKLTRLIHYFYTLKYLAYSAFKRKSGVNFTPRPLKLVVSLTSYPPRINSVFLTIESLLNQTFKPDKIILWLSQLELNPDDIPDNLLKLKTRGLEIRWADDNIKSYKKLIYTLVEFSDYHIVTCDDDLMYHRWFLQGLHRCYQQHPDCISAYRCRTMGKIDANQLTPYNTWQFSNSQIPAYNIFPTSGGGAWYPPDALNKQVSDRLFMRLSPSSDDTWFKAMSLLNQTKTVMVKPKIVEFPVIYSQKSQQQTLWQQNIRDNDQQLKAVFDYFNLYHLIENNSPQLK